MDTNKVRDIGVYLVIFIFGLLVGLVSRDIVTLKAHKRPEPVANAEKKAGLEEDTVSIPVPSAESIDRPRPKKEVQAPQRAAADSSLLPEKKKAAMKRPAKTSPPRPAAVKKNKNVPARLTPVETSTAPEPVHAAVPEKGKKPSSAAEKKPHKNARQSSNKNKQIDTNKMVYIPPGPFIFGKKESGREINLPGYYIGRFEVSNADYQEYNRHYLFPAGEENYPVTGISFFDAVEYAEWRGGRLPTEEEWEKAGRGPDGNMYPWGNTFDASRCNIIAGSVFALQPVDAYDSGVSPYGCLNMFGNAWEWVMPRPTEQDNEMTIVKGGSNLNPRQAVLAASRLADKLGTYSSVGFRYVKDRK